MQNLFNKKSNPHVVFILSSFLLSVLVFHVGFRHVIRPLKQDIAKFSYQKKQIVGGSKMSQRGLREEIKSLKFKLESIGKDIIKEQKKITTFSSDSQVKIITAFNNIITNHNLILKQQSLKTKSIKKAIKRVRRLPVPSSFIHSHKKTNKKHNKIKTNKSVGSNFLKTVVYTYSVEGIFSDIHSALQQFAEIPYFFKVNNISLRLLPTTKQKNTEYSPAKLECSFELNIMFPKGSNQ